MAELWQLLGSLGAVGLLVLLVRALRLGSSGAVDEAAVRQAAATLAHDFDPVEVAFDPATGAALARGRDGRIMLLKVHGAHWAGRTLDRAASARYRGNTLLVDTGDRRFGLAHFHLPEADRWKTLIDRL